MDFDTPIIFNEDDNARDEFSAQHFFQKKRSFITDITNSQAAYSNNFNLKAAPILTKNDNFKKCIFGDSTNIKLNNGNNGVIISLKRKSSGLPLKIVDINAKKSRTENRSNQIDYFVPYQRDNRSNAEADLTEEIELDSLSELNNIYTESELVGSLSVPASGYNQTYTNRIAVAEPWRCEKLLKIEHKSAIWRAIIESSKVENRVLSSPCRESCSPIDQYSNTPILQYKSKCLIQKYHSSLGHNDSFTEAISIDAVYRAYGYNPNKMHGFMPESINTFHFHELYLEKLLCNNLYDFMPQNQQLTGIILGGFLNNYFEMAKTNKYLSNEVMHIAIDYMYQYLSRVQDVPLNDLKLVALGAIWVALKYDGKPSHDHICKFANCTLKELKHAELRLLMVIDFNVSKPNAIIFRNRYLVIETPRSIVSNFSNFILDMTLHCYTVMILPASKRAAAAVWLSRLIQKFEDVQLNDVSSDGDVCDLQNRMTSVWPEHYHKLTGYHHSEISQLAIRMHVIVLAFLCHEQKKKSSVNACCERYSSDEYKNLTHTYAKFTSRIVYFGANFYCTLHKLNISEWLGKKEYETLQMSVCESRPSWRRYNYSFVNQSGDNELEANSCPELTARQMVRNLSFQNVFSVDSKASLKKIDSGYSTNSNHTMDTN